MATEDVDSDSPDSDSGSEIDGAREPARQSQRAILKFYVEVDVFGRHSLSCKKSEGRHFRHSALNDIVKRGLSAAHISPLG